MPPSLSTAGMFTLALRLVVGWTYFSAFWRRVALTNKLDPDTANYIGIKFNHFLPNALGIKPIIEQLVSNPDQLWYAMVGFTIVEGIVGLLLMLGLFTRLMSLGVVGLAFGILLGSGWLGTTCLDEWQIGILGIAAGSTIFFTGSGHFSLDKWMIDKKLPFTGCGWFPWAASGELPIKAPTMRKLVLGSSIAVLALSMYTNQVFHGGVWGTLHNLSVKPKVEVTDAQIKDGKLSFTVFRVEGVDVYGSFLIGVSLVDEVGNVVFHKDGEALAKMPASNIDNAYIAKVQPGAHSMIIPLGAKAQVSFDMASASSLSSGNYQVVLTDISGATWHTDVQL